MEAMNRTFRGATNKGLLILFGSDYQKWSYYNAFLKMVTPKSVSDSLFTAIQANPKWKVDPHWVIWDTCGGIGTDSIQLARHFRNKIVSTEINADTFAYLVNNINQFDFGKQITYLNADCLKVKIEKPPDVVYFDPPWGASYSSDEPFDLNQCPLASNGEPSTMKFIEKWLLLAKMLIIKSPIKSDTVEKFCEDDERLLIHIYKFPSRKLKFILLRKITPSNNE